MFLQNRYCSLYTTNLIILLPFNELMPSPIDKFLPILFRDLTTFGGAIFYGLIVFLAFAFNQTTFAIDLIFGFVISLAIVVPIRLLYFKNRPQKQAYSNFLERIDAASFPSWHTARAVFMALTGIFYFNNLFLTVISSILALLVCYSRIYLQKHDWMDVLGGVTLAGVTYWIINLI